MFNLIIPIGFLIISSIYLIIQLYTMLIRAHVKAKAYKTDWRIYNTIANFQIDHLLFWLYFITWIYSLHVIITGGYSL